MIVDPKVGVLPSSIYFALFYVVKTRHARTNIFPCVVRSTGNSPVFPFLGQNSCRTYRRGDLPLLCGTLRLSDIDCCVPEDFILGYFSLPSPQ